MLAHLIGSYGYAILFLVIAIESLGIPLPGETSLVTAAAFAAAGRLDIILVVLAAATGALVGDNTGYWLGRRGGVAFVERYGARIGLGGSNVRRVHRFFERYGARTVFFGRFIALLRSWAAILAGVGGMRYREFVLFNSAGGITWAVVFGTLGYLFGRDLPRLKRYGGQVTLAIALLVTLVALVWLLGRWFARHRAELSERAVQIWQRFISQPRLAEFRARHLKAISFIGARFARGEYLGLHLTIGFAVSVAALWLFGGVTEDVIHHDPLTVIDVQLAGWFRSHATTVVDRFAGAISALGSPATMTLVAIAVAIILSAKKQWILLGGWIATFAGGAVLDWMLKRIVQRPRPSGAIAFLHGSSFSFPSGHAMGALCGYGMLVYLLMSFWATRWRARTFVPGVVIVLIVAIGASRLYLGVHYLSDVIAGYAAGTVWLVACISGVEIAAGQRGLYPWQIGLERRSAVRDSKTD